MTKITNDFHGTEYRTRKSPKELRKIAEKNPHYFSAAEKRFVRKVQKKLCGMASCSCGWGIFSERGRQEWENA